MIGVLIRLILQCSQSVIGVLIRLMIKCRRLSFRLHHHQLRALSRVMGNLNIASLSAVIHATRVTGENNNALLHYVDLAHLERIESAQNTEIQMSPVGNSATVEIDTGTDTGFTIRSFAYHPSSAAVIFMFTGN